MELRAVMWLLLLGVLLRTTQGQSDDLNNSEEERRALMLKVSLLFPNAP